MDVEDDGVEQVVLDVRYVKLNGVRFKLETVEHAMECVEGIYYGANGSHSCVYPTSLREILERWKVITTTARGSSCEGENWNEFAAMLRDKVDADI